MNYRYTYKCDKCNRDYVEYRPETQEPVHSTCECSGTFVLDSAEEWGITETPVVYSEEVTEEVQETILEENNGNA